jgi:hypothetical protein
MLTSTKPRSDPPRATRTPNPPPISYPIPAPRPSSQTTITSPSTSQPRGRRPSISNTMHWLSRNSTQSTSTPYAPSKPTRISEPKLVRTIELMSARSGVLGSGATVVRTPDEALRKTGVRLTFDGKARDERDSLKELESARNSLASDNLANEIPLSLDESYPSPQSPPLPPLPMPEEGESQFLAEVEVEVPKAPPRPTRAPPPAPPLRPSLKAKPVSATEESFPTPPPLPINLPTSPSPPPFNPILVSEIPSGVVDPSKIIITLETCTTTYRTTLDTLTSRPSHLSTYVSSLFPRKQRASAASSIYSTASDDMSTYRHHLTSQGLLPQVFSIHIFLDRPSAPYVKLQSCLLSFPPY